MSRGLLFLFVLTVLQVHMTLVLVRMERRRKYYFMVVLLTYQKSY